VGVVLLWYRDMNICVMVVVLLWYRDIDKNIWSEEYHPRLTEKRVEGLA